MSQVAASSIARQKYLDPNISEIFSIDNREYKQTIK
jgi:hypothetical protein